MNEQKRMWKLAGRYSTVGIEMAIAVAIGSLGGQWLDERFNTGGWLTAFGFIVGSGAASLTIIRLIKDFKKSTK